MSFFFLLNNLHFAVEILGALAFLMVAWLAFDAFLSRRDFLTISRCIGFIFLILWQVIHAFNFPSESVIYAGYAVYFFGIAFIVLNLFLERPPPRPHFKAVLVLPAISAITLPVNSAVMLGVFFITLLSFRQYRMEFKKALKPFFIGFFFLTLGAAFSIYYDPDTFDAFWIAGHIFELVGFSFLALWVWKYLELRIREEILLIFISAALFIAVVVTLTFSSIFITRLERETAVNLLTDTKVMELSFERLQEEALAKVRLLAGESDIAEAIKKNDVANLEKLLSDVMAREKLGFLTLLDKDGYVLVRAHALSKRDDNLREERAVARALHEMEPFVTIESGSAEKFSIRAAAPLSDAKHALIGVLVGGFLLDNAFVDGMKRITGLEISLFDHDTIAATTAMAPDGNSRGTGLKQTDQEVLGPVLREGQEITVRTIFLSRPFLASYLPIRNADGMVVGMISAAQSQREILSTAEAVNRLTLVIIMVIMIILLAPIYILTRRLSKEVGSY